MPGKSHGFFTSTHFAPLVEESNQRSWWHSRAGFILAPPVAASSLSEGRQSLAQAKKNRPAALRSRVGYVDSVKIAGRLTGHAAEVTELSFSADSATALSAGNDHVLILWDVPKGAILRKLKGTEEKLLAK